MSNDVKLELWALEDPDIVERLRDEGMHEAADEIESLQDRFEAYATRHQPQEREGVLEEAARVAYVTCAKTRHVRLGTECEQAIRALKTTPAPVVGMSACNKCGAEYPSAPAGTVHKCGRCSGGYCSPCTPAPPSEREAVLEEALSRHGLVLTDDPDFDHDEQTFEKAKASFVAALTTPAPAVSTDEIDQLVGYAAHDDDCAVNVLVYSGKCSCGLTAILSRLRGEG